MNLERWMNRALRLACIAERLGEVPVGAIVLSPNGDLLGIGFNYKENSFSPIRHAEIMAIERASQRLRSWRLEGCTLLTTLEPCIMCSGAIVQARIAKVYYGARDLKGGGLESLYQLGSDPRLNHRLQTVMCLQHKRSSQILSDFFKTRRK